MTNKILITVGVPMIDEEYDIYIPVSKNIKLSIDLIVKAINELTNGHFPIKDNYIMINSNGEILSKSKTIKESNLKNGDKVILV